MRILVTGRNGQLGSEIELLAKSFDQYTYIFTSRDELDITDELSVDNFFAHNSMGVLINCAAYTEVDRAEDEPEQANIVNHLAVGYLAQACKRHDVKMIHISTDYVFNGKSTVPYKETDVPNPINIYGKTKLNGEKILQLINPNGSVIIRSSWLYSRFGKNFVNTILKLANEKRELKIVCDQIGSPTNAADLARALLTIIPSIDSNKVELFHFNNQGYCSWFTFAEAIIKMKNLNNKMIALPSVDYPTAATRPNYSVLCNKKIVKRFGLDIPSWEDSLYTFK